MLGFVRIVLWKQPRLTDDVVQANFQVIMWYCYCALSENFCLFGSRVLLRRYIISQRSSLVCILFRPGLGHKMTTPDQDMLEQARDPRITLTSCTSILLVGFMGNHDSIHSDRLGDFTPVSKV